MPYGSPANNPVALKQWEIIQQMNTNKLRALMKP